MANELSSHSLTIASYNSNGSAADRRLYIDRLLESCDVLFTQEHWLNDDGLRSWQQNMDSAFIYGKSGMKKDELLLGRPYGGLSIIVKKSLSCVVHPISDIESDRLFACTLKLNDACTLLLLNVYLPCDDNCDDRSMDVYINVLHEVVLIIERFSLNVDGVVLGGDFNTDLSRESSRHTNLLTDFISTTELFSCLSHSSCNVHYTFCSRSSPVSKSVIDHFFVSDTIASVISSVHSVHDGDNLSDHVPVVLRLNIGCQFQLSDSRVYTPKHAWHRASDENLAEYKRVMTVLLESIEPPFGPLTCDDPNNCDHRREIDDHVSFLNAACMAASEVCIPKSKRKRVAGWSEHVSRFKEKSIFWHRIWLESGCPASGTLFDVMKHAKRDYKTAVKQVMRDQESLSNARMAEALSNNNSRDFWAEIKRKSSNHSPSPAIMDGIQGDEMICELFRNKFDGLYNSVPYDEREMNALRNALVQQAELSCMNGNCYCNHRVYVDEVSDAVRKLKKGKSGGPGAPSSDHFMNAPRELYIHLALLFTTCIHHSYMSNDILGSCIIPIPKNAKKSKHDSDNYRSIAIGSIMCKILDHIVIAKHCDVLNTSSLQFGFKAKHSTVQCSFVVQEVLDFYVENDAVCHVLLLDATKAFDRVHFIKLFDLLVKRNMCPLTMLLLLHVYTHQSMVASWNGCTSERFNCSNGVKQGGVISPLLFCVYVVPTGNRTRAARTEGDECYRCAKSPDVSRGGQHSPHSSPSQFFGRADPVIPVLPLEPS